MARSAPGVLVWVLVALLLAGVGSFFFFNDAAATEFYTLSLHDALPISLTVKVALPPLSRLTDAAMLPLPLAGQLEPADPERTRLHSSHTSISLAVFCLTENALGPLLVATMV